MKKLVSETYWRKKGEDGIRVFTVLDERFEGYVKREDLNAGIPVLDGEPRFHHNLRYTFPSVLGMSLVVTRSGSSYSPGEINVSQFGADFEYVEGTSDEDLDFVRSTLDEAGLERETF